MITTQKHNLPVFRLRFKDVHGNDYPDWEMKSFGDCYEFKPTNSFSRNKLNYEAGQVYNIHYGDIHTKFKHRFELSHEDVPFINMDIDLKNISEENFCKEGDLIIADASEDYADIGKTIEIISSNGEKILAGLHTLLARLSNKELYIGYGAYMISCESVRKQIKIIAQGIKVLSISAGRMKKIRIPIPSFEEQQKIASFLASVDNKIEQFGKKKALLEQYKKGIVQKLFSQELRFKDVHGNNFPEWEKKPLREFVQLNRKITYGIVQPGKFVEKGIPLVRGGDYSFGWVPLSQIKCVTKEIDQPYKRSKLQSGDLLLTIVGANTGTVAVVPDWLSGANITQTTARIAINNIQADSSFVKQCLLSSIGQKEVRKYVKGAAQPGLNLSDVEKFMINAPSLPEQKKIADFLSALDKRIDLIATALKHAQIFKKGLLQKMFI